MPHVLVAGRIHDAGIDLLRRAPDITFDYVEEVSLASFAPLIGSADGLIVRTQPVSADLVAQAPRLRIVARFGVGYDAVDVKALSARGIPLAIVGDVNSRCVAEHALMLMLATARRLNRYDAGLRAGDWQRRDSLEAIELYDKTLLIVGFGRIGHHVAAMAQAFGMRILAFDPYQPAEAIAAGGAQAVADLRAALPQADFVTLHAPKTDSWPLLGEAELRLMQPSAILVNTARGGAVDEAALLRALDDGRLAAAGLDVFAAEPPPSDDPLLRSDRVIVTPHSAGLTRECAARMSVAVARNVLAAFEGRLDPALVVNAGELGLNTIAAPARGAASA